MQRSQVDECLRDIGQRMGMPGLRLDDRGCCQLLFDQRWLVTLVMEQGSARGWLHCPLTLAAAAPGLAGDTLLALLQAQFMGHGGLGRGGGFAVAPDGRVYAQQALDIAQLGAGGLYNAIDQLLNLSEKWARRIEQGPNGGGPKASSRELDWMARRV